VSAELPAEGCRTTTPFHDLTEFAAIPRVTALRLSPDGQWLAAAVQTLSADGKKYLTSGNKDYRVPVSEALRLWWDLSRYGAEAKFLYFPDENHWILTPGHARLWYETVFAFLAEHVLGQEWQRPALL